MPEHYPTSQQYQDYLKKHYFPEFLVLNYKPLNWVHDHWLEDLGNASTLKTVDSHKVQQWVRQSLGYPELDIRFFELPLARLVLLPQDKLHFLLQAIGLACYYPLLPKLIERNKKHLLDDICGKSTVQYIQQNVPFFFASQPALLIEILNSIPFYNDRNKQFADFVSIGAYIVYLAVNYECNIKENSPSDSMVNQSKNWHRCLMLKLAKPKQTLSIGPLSSEQNSLNKVRLLVTKLTRHLEPSCVNLYE